MRWLVLAAALAPSFGPRQDPALAFPNNYRLVLDNPDVAVLRVHYGPHEKVGSHDHSAFATVYVYLNDSGPVRFQHREEARPFDLVRPPTHAGAFRVSPGRLERHSVENLSDKPSEFLRIELKRLPVHSLPAEFRGPAPAPPLRPGTVTVYNNPKLRIERIVCAGRGPCTVPKENRASVLVQPAGEPSGVGEVHWVPAGSSFTVPHNGEAAYRFLRVVVPGSSSR